VPESFFDSKPLVKISVMSIDRIRLSYGRHAVDFLLSKHDLMAITDASADHHYVNVRPAEAFETSQSFQPIPCFSDLWETTNSQATLTSIMAEAINELRADEKTVLLPIPNGVYFSRHLMEPVLKRMEQHLELCATLFWLRLQLDTVTPPFSQIQFEPNNLRLFFSSNLTIAGYVVTLPGTWKVVMAPSG
jgi:hypothetical protein